MVDYMDEFGRKRQCKRKDLPQLQELDREGLAERERAERERIRAEEREVSQSG